MLNIERQKQKDKNPYEAFFNKEITLEEFALLLGLEPHLVIIQLKELISEHENQYKFSPSLALYQISEDLFLEYTQLNEEETKDRIHMKLQLHEGIRKATRTLDELRRVRQSTVVIQNNLTQINVEIENILNKVVPYLCPKCQEKLLERYEEIVPK